MTQSKKKKTSSWYRQLHQWKQTIDGALNDPEQLKRAISCGYSKKILETAINLHQEIIELDQLKEVAYGRKYAATDACSQAKVTLHKSYMRHLSLARIVFKQERGTLEKLRANGKRKTALADWLTDIRKFYHGAISDLKILNVFKKKGIVKEELEKGIELAQEVETLYQVQKKLTEEAVDSTYKRDEKLNELRNWFIEFNATTRIVGKEIDTSVNKSILLKASINT